MEHNMPSELIVDGTRYVVTRDDRDVPSNTDGNAAWSLTTDVNGDQHTFGVFYVARTGKYVCGRYTERSTALAILQCAIKEYNQMLINAHKYFA